MTPKHVADFPPDTRWVQFPNSAIAVVSQDEVYRVGPTGVIPLTFPEPKRRKKAGNPPAVDTGD